MTIFIYITIATVSVALIVLLCDWFLVKMPLPAGIGLWILKVPVIIINYVLLGFTFYGYGRIAPIIAVVVALIVYQLVSYLLKIREDKRRFRFMRDLFLIFTPYTIILATIIIREIVKSD
ncbi:MAG: hypothetical protein PF637_09320 [Spirochaetes bacterium]|jgi:hypothetical protein|nr:hypothetical protein [Spirochaetota bacterium]